MTEQKDANRLTGEGLPIPLAKALTFAVIEFEKLPPTRKEGEDPSLIAFFKGEKSLVVLQKRRPLETPFGLINDTFRDGYFVEAFELDENGRSRSEINADKEYSVSEVVKKVDKMSIEERDISNRFQQTYQGLSRDVGLEHFVITNDENSPLVVASKALGIETVVLRPNSDFFAKKNPIEDLRDKKGKLPLIISFDGSGNGEIQGIMRALAIEYGKKQPLFAFIDLEGDEKPKTFVGHVSPGWFYVRGKDVQVLRRLFTKINVDYALTVEVRKTAEMVNLKKRSVFINFK